jgi:hypothetical protein
MPTASLAFNPERETTPLIEWLAGFRSHYLAASERPRRRHDPMMRRHFIWIALAIGSEGACSLLPNMANCLSDGISPFSF